MEYSFQEFINQYNILTKSPDVELRNKASQYTMNFQNSQQAWGISRELLVNSNDAQFQFLGIQMLYNKIKFEFATLDKASQLEIRKFIFDSLSNSFSKHIKVVFVQLCSAAALVGVLSMTTTWPDFLDDILKFSQSSEENLVAGLQILENIEHELDIALLPKKTLMMIKDTFAASSSKITEFLLMVMSNSKHDQLVERTLRAMYSWAQLKIQLLDHTQVVDLLLSFITMDKYFKITVDILIEALNNSKSANILSSSGLANALNLIPVTTKASVKKIIEFVAQKSADNYLENINNEESQFCRGITELVTAIGVQFNVFILENNEYSQAILKLLLMCASHRNRKISYFCFDFWTSFQSVIKNIASDLVQHLDCGFITQSYISLLRIILRNCKRPSLSLGKSASQYQEKKGKVFNLETGENEDEDDGGFGKEDEEDDVNRMSLKDYRSHADDVSLAIYSVLQLLKGEEGIKEVFAEILPILTQPNIPQPGTPEYVDHMTECEARINSVLGMFDNMNLESPHQYVCETIASIIKLPQEEIIVKSALQFLYESNNQLPFLGTQLTIQVFQYILKQLLNPVLCYLASQCFQSIAESTKASLDLETLKYIADFMGANFMNFKNESVLDAVLQGIFSLSWDIENEEIKAAFQQKAFEIVDMKFNHLSSILTAENIKNPEVKEEVKKVAMMLESLYRGIDQQNRSAYQSFYQIVILEFIRKHLPLYLKYLELFSENSIHGFHIVQTFSRILKLVIRICDIDLAPNYNDLMSCVLLVFRSNPVKHCAMLSTFSFIVFAFAELPEQQNWLRANFSDFNRFVITTFTQNQDPDLIRNFIAVHSKVYEKYMDYYLTMPELSELIMFFLNVYKNVSEYQMLKEILQFLHLLFGTTLVRTSEVLISLVPKLIETIIFMLPDISHILLVHVANVISSLLKELSDESQNVSMMFINAMNIPKYNSKVDDKMKKVFVNGLFVCKDDLRSMKLILSEFYNILNSNAPKDNIVQIDFIVQQKMKDARGKLP